MLCLVDLFVGWLLACLNSVCLCFVACWCCRFVGCLFGRLRSSVALLVVDVLVACSRARLLCVW